MILRKYSILWNDGKEEILELGPEQAANMSMLPNVLQVELQVGNQ